ncbi:MAG: class I SAM-dependent methyltransferase [Nitrososphaeraceae archaeon]
MKILNLGCGNDYKEGMINIDFYAKKTDIRHNLNNFPYPFDDNEFDRVLCMNIIEHLNDVVSVIEELHRISKNGADILMRVPHFRSACLYEDITHQHGFAWKTMDIFCQQGEVYGEYSNVRFEIIDRYYTPYKIKLLYAALSKMPLLTDHLLSKFIPMASIIFNLKVVK